MHYVTVALMRMIPGDLSGNSQRNCHLEVRTLWADHMLQVLHSPIFLVKRENHEKRKTAI